MAFRVLYTYHGGGVPTLGCGITAAETWDRGDIVVRVAAGTISEGADDSSDVLGVALEPVTTGAALGPDTNTALVSPFMPGVVYAVNSPSSQTFATANIGEQCDLDLVSGDWGILAGTSATANTPQFIIVDIDTVRNEAHVIIAPAGVADVFQTWDATV